MKLSAMSESTPALKSDTFSQEKPLPADAISLEKDSPKFSTDDTSESYAHEPLGRARRTLKNEDSSYGSDHEASPDVSHDDVSRTVSETLGAEFAEYVSLKPAVDCDASTAVSDTQQVIVTCCSTSSYKVFTTNACTTTSPVTNLAVTSSHRSLVSQSKSTSLPVPVQHKPVPVTHSLSLPRPGQTATASGLRSVYQNQLEFANKLGYSEPLVQIALDKLGGNPAKNELLDELIRLGDGIPKADKELEAASSAENNVQTEDLTPQLRPIIIDGSNVALR